MSFIDIRNVKKNYGKVTVLKGPSIQIEEGEQVVIEGASGSGKSTLLHILGGLEKMDSGEVFVGGQSLKTKNDEQLASYRNTNVGLVFQFHFLLASMNCRDNILLPARIAGIATDPVEARTLQYAKDLGVDHCLDKFPYELSGGEQQRVNIIRALSLSPRLLLCDEPTGNLDSKNSAKVVELLRYLAKENKSTLVFVTHDHQAAAYFPRKFYLKDGIFV